MTRSAPPLIKPPDKRDRAAMGQEERVTYTLQLKTITPIMGGGTVTRDVDHVDIIRAPSIRGALRFWWRALRDPGASPQALHQAEKALWGGMGSRGDRDDKDVKRSLVEVRVSDVAHQEIDSSDLSWKSENFYALWPAQKQSNGTPVAPRYGAGLRFTLVVSAPVSMADEIKHAISAWILFGGYGGRTRRGVGSLTLTEPKQCEQWLPKHLALPELRRVLGARAFTDKHPASETPSLLGARLYTKNATAPNPLRAWQTTLDWLRDFRQGEARSFDQNANHARNKGQERSKPGRSNWPEADKLRHIDKRNDSRHAPRHNATPAWPRSGFGLPILGQFIDRNDPGKFTLTWIDAAGVAHDRLASPLIIKAVPLADGKSYAPVALWLNRAYPDGGRVVKLRQGADKDGYDRRSAAEFDLLVARGDQAHFNALNIDPQTPQGARLQTAFFNWLEQNNLATEVK